MTEDANDTSNWLDGPQADKAIINEVLIEGFHTLYKIQIGELKKLHCLIQEHQLMQYHLSFPVPYNNNLKLYQLTEK